MTEKDFDLCYSMARNEATLRARFMNPKPTGKEMILLARSIAQESISRLLAQEASLLGVPSDTVATLGGLDGDAEPTP